MEFEPFKSYSRRLAEANGELPDVYEYDFLPDEFRYQVYHVLVELYNEWDPDDDDVYSIIHREACKRLGVGQLANENMSIEKILWFILNEPKTEKVLDLIEYTLHVFANISSNKRDPNNQKYGRAVEEINYWFEYNSLGYEFLNGHLVRKDTQVLHSEAVKPALFFLSDPRFAGANEEMMNAYEARRKGKNRDAITNAGKAFESVMKSICTEKGYAFDAHKDTAKKLVSILKAQAYFPAYMNAHIDGIMITLESGLPTVRNKLGGHGQGQTVIAVSDEFADYALNLAATNIAFLARLL